MEVQLNEFTKVEVESRLTIFHLNNAEKKVQKILYLRNDKIIGAELAKYRFFSFKKFLFIIVIGLLVAAGQYVYDTVQLGYEPNYTNMALFGLVTIIVLTPLFGFTKKRHLKILVDSDESGPLNRNRFSFPVGGNISEKKLMDLMYLLAT